MLDNYTFGISSSLLIKALDVFIVSFLIYRALLIVRGTRAAPMLVGLASIAVVYAIAKPLGLVTVAWLIDNFLNSIILVIVVIECLLTLIMTTPHASTTVAADRIDLIDKDNAGRVLLALNKEVSHP